MNKVMGPASEIKTHQIEIFHGAFTNSGPINTHINRWLALCPEAQIIDMKYTTYTLPDANGEMSLGETVLIIYKEV
ncbi:hypothetical protein JOD82_002117 [Paenibacillus sp. 1182]|uniref:hypothetical protein n=1 Tax=Paenibacillus sp. 1182 TaxID=2806565 RepID=UPI001AE558D7|nr:hypothetical protein [Paenibacillus sp. 1182]MBP1309097.1 hypothetical protein [Paenibacillus sp. 1182]